MAGLGLGRPCRENHNGYSSGVLHVTILANCMPYCLVLREYATISKSSMSFFVGIRFAVSWISMVCFMVYPYKRCWIRVLGSRLSIYRHHLLMVATSFARPAFTLQDSPERLCLPLRSIPGGHHCVLSCKRQDSVPYRALLDVPQPRNFTAPQRAL